MPMQRFNQGKKKFSDAGYPLVCPKCIANLEETDGLNYSEGNLRVIESSYKCDCGYQLTITEKAPYFFNEIEKY